MLTDDNTLAKKFARDILKYVSEDIRKLLLNVDKCIINSIEEIRLRAGKPAIIQNYRQEWFLNTDGSLTEKIRNPHFVSQDEILKTLQLMSENSIYAYQDEIKNGFLTLKGGHRIGIAGRVVLNGCDIKTIKEISGMNIRFSKEVRGCCSKVLRYIINDNHINNTLIISPPQCGKTTMLRDIARTISNGCENPYLKGIKVGVIDERSEIASCYKGIPQSDVGMRTDVLDACPKSIGMTMMIRSMSPQVIITDEIGNQGDSNAIRNVINSGVKIITSAHGYNVSELKSRREVIGLMEEKVFDRYIVLNNSQGPGTIKEVIDGNTMETIDPVEYKYAI